MRKYTSKTFTYNQDFKKINFRKEPLRYEIGRGEQGVLLVEPYKSEILPFWRFRTVEIAKESSQAIYKLFLRYKKEKDFVGMDMARKFLQMGYTRARRYANHPSGKKYRTNPQKEKNEELERVARKNVLPQSNEWKDGEKAQAARIFYGIYLKVKNDPTYLKLKENHIKLQNKKVSHN